MEIKYSMLSIYVDENADDEQMATAIAKAIVSSLRETRPAATPATAEAATEKEETSP